MTSGYQKVLRIFKKHYREIPLVLLFKNPFQTLVGVMLSARTRDQVTAKVGLRLFKRASTPQKIAKMTLPELEEILRPIGFYKTKAKHLKNLSESLVKDFDGKVPQTLEQLTSLPGVGRKTANIVLAQAFNIPAIGVDTHVHRIANFLGWVKTKRPKQTEQELAKIIPKKDWTIINHLFVSIGQQYRNNTKLKEFLQEFNIIDK